jgi:hypothetical protein
MTINNQSLYEKGIWDWGILDGCFGETKIKPTDIDGAVERNGKYLFLETKQPGAQLPVGQFIFYKRLVDMGNTVIFIWGENNNPVELRIITPHIDKVFKPSNVKTDMTTFLRETVASWFAWAESQNKVQPVGKVKHR